MMTEGRFCVKVDTKCQDCGHKIKRCKSSEDNFVIIVTKQLNFVILKKMTSMLRRLIFYLDYWLIERTSFYLLEKVTFLSQLLLTPTVSFYGQM